MECTKCKKKLELSYFSYKDDNKKIFYLHCDKCREKISMYKNKKEIEIENYNVIKETKIIECVCGKKYIAFRNYHIKRHECTKNHLKNINNKK
tara:strand:- start:8519 stop:8797 length:279 start_codon:yes stop_codon:yes gene_type:complete